MGKNLFLKKLLLVFKSRMLCIFLDDDDDDDELFFGMLDLQIAGSCISRRDNCQEASPS